MTPTDSDVITTYLAPDEFYDTFTLSNEVVQVLIEAVVVNGEDAMTALDTAQESAEEMIANFNS